MTGQIHHATIALGANLGDREATLLAAVNRLKEHAEIFEVRVSPLYRTKPIDAHGPDFCNAAAKMETTLGANELLQQLLEIEQQLGRTRSVRNAPRTIDLDLIAYDYQTASNAVLTLPHPRAHERAFVLIPLCEINDSVLLGPPNEPEKKPASHWLSQLSEAQRSEVASW
jgi:2-amino-4-hydroxy-6-hydroxymethyldihydropteridine diphosphokinase